MSNSVYVANGVEKCASIVTGYVATTADAAKSKPVDLYVERVVAKVQLLSMLLTLLMMAENG